MNRYKAAALGSLVGSCPHARADVVGVRGAALPWRALGQRRPRVVGSRRWLWLSRRLRLWVRCLASRRAGRGRRRHGGGHHHGTACDHRVGGECALYYGPPKATPRRRSRTTAPRPPITRRLPRLRITPRRRRRTARPRPRRTTRHRRPLTTRRPRLPPTPRRPPSRTTVRPRRPTMRRGKPITRPARSSTRRRSTTPARTIPRPTTTTTRSDRVAG